MTLCLRLASSLIVTLVLGGVLHGVAPLRAHACSGPQCWPDRFLPFEGELPANADGILWAPGRTWDDATGASVDTKVGELLLRCGAPDDEPRMVELEAEPLDGEQTLLRPVTPLIAGEHCELVSPLDCTNSFDASTHSYLGQSAQLEIIESTPLPLSLGTLSATRASAGAVEAWTAHGSCSVTEPACVVEISLELSEEAAAWSDAFVFSTFVDGEEWSFARGLGRPNVTGGSAVGRGRDVLFSWVDAAGTQSEVPGLAAGSHRVSIRATLPGTDIEVQSDEVTVDLRCGGTSDEPRAGESGCSVVSARGLAAAGTGRSIAGGMHASIGAWLVLMFTARRARRARRSTSR